MERLIRGERVERHTQPCIQKRINEQTMQNMLVYSQNPARLSQRISELEDEWDIERYIELNASCLAFTGLVLGYWVHRSWLLLTGLVLIFLFQHAIQGWCPPVPIFRRLGKRTRLEIDEEMQALKAIRGDFDSFKSPLDALNAAKKH